MLKARLHIIILLFACMCAYCARAYAQATDTIRYVRTTGAYNNDGKSWANAKNNVQDAINDLYNYLLANNLTSGSVYVAAGTYVPTESTEDIGGSMLNTSFKIYAGIHVYGGFNPNNPESKPGDRIMANDKKCSENWADPSGTGTTSGVEIASQWDLKHKTILTGNHSTTPVSFTFDAVRGRFNTTFPASSYHVVWFATNGLFTENVNDSTAGHFKPLEYPASVDGCVISSGNASSRNTNFREHTAYGGGVYMVGNSTLRNCTVERCNAALAGGGIYMDGGGVAEFCYVHTCQSTGVGVVKGYGGGVCIEHEGTLGHSHVTSCAARCGGGLLISHEPEEYPRVDNISFYSPHATACVINNNTAAAEGGGIYLAEGGTINHCTVTANNCISPDVTYYGRRHGRTGGIYIRNCGMIFNSVFWGNKCATNNDIQFASIQQKVDSLHEVFVYHSAFMNHDISDWTGVQKEVVFSLDKSNLPVKGSTGNFPCFFKPTVYPLKWDSIVPSDSLYGAGVITAVQPVHLPGPRIWHLTSHSDLDQKGVQYSSAMVNPPLWLINAHTDYGVVSNPYEPASTLGALVRRPDKMRHALYPQQGLEGRKDATPIPTIFVDLHHEGDFDNEGNFITHSYFGDSWEEPLRSIGDALMYYRTYLVEEPNKPIGQRAHYRLPTAWDASGNPTEYADYDFVQLLVKEGEQSTAGPNNYIGKDMRTASIRTLSHMRLYGGYPESLTGTDTEGRDPLNYPTVITANVADEKGEVAYQNNSAHVLTYVNSEYSIVDGFQLLNGNSHHLNGTQAVMAGGGVLVSNEITSQANRIDMVGNELRNCCVANNSAPKGAAIYVTGDSKRSLGFFPGPVCYAELKVVNCIIRNNTADYSSGNNGIVTANGRAFIDIDHCDIVNNVGYPLQSDNRMWKYSDIKLDFQGYIRVDNSLIFCNGNEVLNDRSALLPANVLSVDAAAQDYIFGTFNMFDADIKLHTDDAAQPHGFFKSDFSVPSIAGVLPSGMPNGHPLKLAMPEEKNNQCIFTRTDRNEATYPVFINPSRNIGHSVEGDRPLFGGKVSFIPLNNNPCVNAASVSAYGGNNIPRLDAEDYDLTDNRRRNYGGEPDIGALEDTDLPVDGTVIYVTPDGAGKRDGSSWDNAIAGNTVYLLNSVAGPALADGDQIDSEPTCDRVLDSEGNPVLTTNPKYNGGWGRVWMNTHTIYSTTHNATVHDHITEKSIYFGGEGDGEDGREVIDGERESREVLPDGENVPSVPEGFVPGDYFDPRYPYGEISDASRSFWRANPYTAGSYGNVNTFTNACNANGWINNTRAERYVGGLQYAVEKASAANKTYHVDSVQVWVGAGTYNDYKGFVMRDSVTVLGGFPANKYKAPGMAERQALMSNVINIPKSKPAENLNAVDYESILQISEVNPKRDNTHLETNAVKYWDDDIDFVEHTTITGEVEADRVITRVYTWQESDIIEDVTATYYQSSRFHDEDTTNNQTVGDFHSFDFGTPTSDKDCWHLSYTGQASTGKGSTGVGNGVIGLYEPQQMSTATSNSGKDIYENGVLVGTTSKNAMFIRNGSLSGVKVWQTMKNVPAGYYRIVVDMNAYYRSGTAVKSGNVPTGVYFIVIGANGDTLVNKQPIDAKGKGYKSSTTTNDLARAQLNRYTFDSIIQPADGSLKVSIEIDELDGSKGNNREVLMENFKLIHVKPGNTYSQTDYSDVRTQHSGSTGSSTSTYSATVTTHRTTLRKRVLTMPDVCVPTYGGGGIGDPVVMGQTFGNDALPHTDRVWGPTKDLRTAATLAKQEDPHYVEYNEASWDGFTIRHGFIYDEAMAHGGGAGVNMYEGGHLRNCIVINNVSACQRVKGAGMFCDGATSTIEGCFVLNNTSTRGSSSTLLDNQIFAGGMFMYEGTCFNSLFANNYSQGSAGGLGFCVGRFYNNTIAYNTATLKEGGQISGGAISLATSSNPNLFVANTIIFGNNGIAIRDRNAGVDKVTPFLYCYIQSAVAQPNATTKNNVYNWSESATSNYGTGNTFLNGIAPSAANTPFAADFNEQGNYVAGRAASLNDFRLRDDVPCVNKGTEEFASEFYTALQHKDMSDSEIRNSFIYKSVEAAQLPDNDVAFAKRVQDCEIDMGAYEFNAAFAIKPDTTSHPGTAIFYVTYDAPGGDASASSPANAACAQKFQLILDAAGRYKHRLMSSSGVVKPVPVAGQPDKGWTVEVWLEGDNTNCTTSDHYADWYTPTRSTKYSMGYNDNTLDYSFIVPHGIQVKGGFAPGYFHYEDDAGNTVDAGTSGAHIVDDRDPLTYRTVLSGKITSNTGAEGNCYHVVTFTNDLFTELEEVKEDGGQLGFLSALPDAETHRAVLDGLFIEDGFANSPDDADRVGGAAVVTGFAHIRNCVVQNNEAEESGGGLYLKPMALVSGTIITKNTANVGGGVYIEAPESKDVDSLAHVFTTTICENKAYATAGGMWFDNTYARVNSTVLWHNSANDYANVSGNFTRTSENTDYPFMFCAVESRRLEGQGNIELSARETEGVRWDKTDPFKDLTYYPIVMSSTLARAGMTYVEWRNTMAKYPTLDSLDIAGVSRMTWTHDLGDYRGFAWGADSLVTKNNDFIEIGARALNKSFEISVNARYVMRRLYVMHTDLLKSDEAKALQDNPGNDDISNMYRQMGSCINNPFHRLGDALEYIIAVRRMEPALYRNARFEVYLEKGTYYPYHNAYGEQGQVRANTFLIPEGTSIIGGVNSEAGFNFGQEGFEDLYTKTRINTNGDGSNVDIPSVGQSITFATSTEIRQRDSNHREMSDYNLNNVIEPWEFARQSILSGDAVSGEDKTHVYHVVTIHADSTQVGPQPIKYRNDSIDRATGYKILYFPISADSVQYFKEECEESQSARAIIFDGVHITSGYANEATESDLATHVYQGKTYFRGGGIFVDGNWTESFEDNVAEIPNVTHPADYRIPLVVQNCQFTNNMAGNGGAIYSNGPLHVYSSHFTQNYSQGPITQLDQNYIPWTAGGCIASNDYCGIVNCLFDNNEARRGNFPINASGDEYIPNADARQGFGGCLSIAEKAKLRLANCLFTRNKAIAYSAIYNFKPNNDYSSHDSIQLAFNTIFWGNEVYEVDSVTGQVKGGNCAPIAGASLTAFNEKYRNSQAGVFHYDGAEWEKYEKLYREYDSLYIHYSALNQPFNGKVTDKLEELRDQGDKVEGLFFCSYRKGYGPSGMKPSKAGYLLNEAEHNNFIDPRGREMSEKTTITGSLEEDYSNLFTHVYGNNNVLINRLNTATDGPNFKQPSPEAGINGYMQNADWVTARLGLTTDQGWGHLKQIVSRDSTYFTSLTGSTPFSTLEAALAAAQAIDPNADNSVVSMHHSTPSATFEGVTKQDTMALYNYLANRSRKQSSTFSRVPIGDEYYMTYLRDGGAGEISGQMRRISLNPRVGVKDVYIDMGIYEYQYVQLDIKGNEVDTMWVATKAKSDKQDGLTWETPTTDLQTAIDILMSSHNNHDKYICFLGDEEGSISPGNVIDNRRAFIITSNTLAPLLPDNGQADTDYGVASLNFLGGYKFDVKDAPRDPSAYPTIVEMPFAGNTTQLNQLFVVEDMTRQMVQANWQGEYTVRDSVVIPITFDGITFINPYSTKSASLEGYDALGGLMSDRGGAAIYYRWQRQYQESSQGSGVYNPNFNMALHPDSALIDGRKETLPKLTISNCQFMDNGNWSVDKERRPATVRIEHGGGASLIVNSLFHSNAGAPIHADRYDFQTEENNLAEVPNDVVIVNSTFALNGGHLTLESDSSQIHNSLIWLDDIANDTVTQLELWKKNNSTIDKYKWGKAENDSIRVGIDKRVTYNAIWSSFLNGDDTFHNDPFATENNNIFEGPNFVSPNQGATTSADRRARNFGLNPAVRTMNMADSTIYRNKVFFRQYPNADNGLFWRRSNGFKLDTVNSLKLDYELAYKPRFYGLGMERGAYECLAVLQRVLYVQPGLSDEQAGDGSSWKSPLSRIQSAIDVAAVFTYLNSRLPVADRRAFVYVKGGNSTESEILARDGVCVFGSIPGNFNDTAYIYPNASSYTNHECDRYMNYVRSITPGLASPEATPTYITSITAQDGDYPVGFLMENFVISNRGKRLDKSPIILDNAAVVVRNCVIENNAVTGGAPVVDLKKGLLYNSLLHKDSAAAFVQLGTQGCLLNNTMVNNYTCEQNFIADNDANRSVNNLTADSVTANFFAPYLRQANPYTLPAYLVHDDELLYQLHECSDKINAGTQSLPAAFNSYVADGLVNFSVDRDILGNPRRIGGQVDLGAFETWRIEPNTAVEISSVTERNITLAQAINAENEHLPSFTKNYRGHQYPHHGSVVYLMDSATISMAYDDPNHEDFKDYRNNTIILRPGFMLMKPGASFYGNGHDVQMNYLAAEKRLVNQRYAMTSFPFDYNISHITTTGYNSAKDSLIAQHSPFNFSTYQYSGAARSAKDYVFQNRVSSAWLPVNRDTLTATEGYLMDFHHTQDTVLRFNVFAANLGDYIYTESGELDRIVYLKQYDNRVPGTGADLDFTSQENMGWNMKGLPWLVSDYRTDTVLEEGNYLRQMFIPHVFYQMNGDGTYTTSGDAISTARSWDAGATMSMGNAFLTQTATQRDSEAVVFHIPFYEYNKKASQPILRLYSSHPRTNSSDILTLLPDTDAEKTVRYAYGRDGIKWLTSANDAQVYLLDNKRQARLSLLGAAPTEVDIPLGVNIPAQTDDALTAYTFSLPEKQAFANYDYVWLIDYTMNRTVNLLEHDYDVELPSGEHNYRFAVRIGGFPKTGEDGQRRYIIFSYDGMLFVRGLVKGDKLDIYTPSGQLIFSTIASDSELSVPLDYRSGYIIKVNNHAKKVVNF